MYLRCQIWLVQLFLCGLITFTVTSDTFYQDATAAPKSKPPNKKCGLIDFVKGKCKSWPGSDLKPQYQPTTPKPVSEEKPLPTSRNSFNFGAFIIALFTSLVIALSGAFACWCCRTFYQQRDSQQHRFVESSSPTFPLEPLVDSSQPPAPFMRATSLPPYSSTVAESSNKSHGASHEDPPPAYSSLFSDKTS